MMMDFCHCPNPTRSMLMSTSTFPVAERYFSAKREVPRRVGIWPIAMQLQKIFLGRGTGHIFVAQSRKDQAVIGRFVRQ